MPVQLKTVLVEKPGLTKEHVILFADAIFSIAITLLALEVRLPAMPEGPTDAAFAQALVETFPALLGFFISFFVIAIYWMGFHRTMQYLRRLDRRMLWLTMGFLFLIALMPFPTSVIGEYGNSVPPTLFYQVSASISSVMMFLMWTYASSGDRLIVDGLDRRIMKVNKIRLLVPAIVMLATVPVTFYNPHLAQLCWLSMIPLIGLVKRIAGIADAQYFE
jgi:uncharacterized membrane protein